MSVEVTGSTVPRRQLGRHLRELRNQQRLTVRAAAERLEWSEAKMWRIETGQTSLRSLDVEAMCRIYGAPTDLTEALMGHIGDHVSVRVTRPLNPPKVTMAAFEALDQRTETR